MLGQHAPYHPGRVWLAGVSVGVACTLSGVLSFVAASAPLLAIGVGVAAVSLAWSGLAPKYFVSLLVLGTVFTRFAVPVGDLNLRVDTLLLLPAIASVVLAGKLSNMVRWASHPVLASLLGFIAINLISTLLQAPQVSSSVSIVAWYLQDWIVCLIVLSTFEDDRAYLRRLMKICAMIAVSAGILGWVTLTAGGPAWGADVEAGSGLRAIGVSWEANILAGYAAIWFVLVLTQERVWSRSDKALALGCLVVIPLTATRAAIVAVLFGLIIYALRSGTGLRRAALMSCLVVPAALIVVISFPRLVEQTFSKYSNFTFTNQTSTIRYDSWRIALPEVLRESPLWGMGTNSFGQRHVLSTDPTHRTPAYLGNLFIQTFYDTGALGALALLLLGGILVANTHKRVRYRAICTLAVFAVVAAACNPAFFASFWLFAVLALIAPGDDPVRQDGNGRRWEGAPAAVSSRLLIRGGS